MQNKNTPARKTKLKSEELDGKIRRLLLYNPQVSIRDAKDQLALLKVRSDDEKREIIDMLSASYKTAIKDACQSSLRVAAIGRSMVATITPNKAN